MLKNSGYKTKLQNQQPKNKHNQNKEKRTRTIIWFNPPHNRSVKTDIHQIKSQFYKTFQQKHNKT